MRRLYRFWLACRIEYHWWHILRYRKRGMRMIESGIAFSNPELIELSQKITGHGMVALGLQREYEDKVLS